MKITPMFKNLLVRRDADVVDEKTKGGLHIPDVAKERPQKGTIISFGQDCTQLWSDGDRVLFGKYAGVEIKVNEVEHLIMAEDQVLGVVVEE